MDYIGKNALPSAVAFFPSSFLFASSRSFSLHFLTRVVCCVCVGAALQVSGCSAGSLGAQAWADALLQEMSWADAAVVSKTHTHTARTLWQTHGRWDHTLATHLFVSFQLPPTTGRRLVCGHLSQRHSGLRSAFLML